MVGSDFWARAAGANRKITKIKPGKKTTPLCIVGFSMPLGSSENSLFPDTGEEGAEAATIW
jgi:hypothetical protein